MKKIFVVFLINFLLISNSYALDCEQADKARLQKLADNISVTIEPSDNQTFVVTFTGLSNDLRIFNPTNLLYYRNMSDKDIGSTYIENLQQGTVYRFEVQSATKSCLVENIRLITVRTPKYNKYYNEEICNSAKEYIMCQKWFDADDISYEEFINDVKSYLKQKKTNKNENLSENLGDGQFDFSFNKFYKNVYLPSLFITLGLMAFLIGIWLKENKKNKL